MLVGLSFLKFSILTKLYSFYYLYKINFVKQHGYTVNMSTSNDI